MHGSSDPILAFVSVFPFKALEFMYQYNWGNETLLGVQPDTGNR